MIGSYLILPTAGLTVLAYTVETHLPMGEERAREPLGSKSQAALVIRASRG